MYRKVILLFIIVVLCIFNISCTASGVPASYVVSSMCSAEPELPPGTLFTSDACPGEAAYASDELLTSLYGDGNFPVALGLCREFALFLSDTFPYGGSDSCITEFAVFYCNSAQDARDISLMCSSRSDIIAAHCALPPSAPLVSVCSTPSGRAVIFIISSDPGAVLNAARHALRENIR